MLAAHIDLEQRVFAKVKKNDFGQQGCIAEVKEKQGNSDNHNHVTVPQNGQKADTCAGFLIRTSGGLVVDICRVDPLDEKDAETAITAIRMKTA